MEVNKMSEVLVKAQFSSGHVITSFIYRQYVSISCSPKGDFLKKEKK